MNIKKIFQIFFLVFVVSIMGGTIYFSTITQRQQKKVSPARAEDVNRPEYSSSNNDPSQWVEFINPDFHYQISYPKEFQVERRGKVGNIEDLVALNYTDGKERLTVVKIQITVATSEEKISTNEKGKDNNGNQVIVFKKPLNDSKTITIIGTIYPNTGSNYRFEEVIQKIIGSLK